MITELESLIELSQPCLQAAAGLHKGERRDQHR
jgi:hypothetical protein